MKKQPEREADDGAVGVGHERIDGRERVVITCHGVRLILSPYNAWRAFGMLSMLLELPLSKAVGRTIKLGNDFKAVIS